MASGFKFFKVLFWGKVACNSAILSCFNGWFQLHKPTLVFFKQSKTSTNDLAGIIITSTLNIRADKIFKIVT